MMSRIHKWAIPMAVPVALASLSGCLADWDGESDANVIGDPDTYLVGGDVTGLDADPVMLSLNDDQEVTVSQDGGFTFTDGLTDGNSYEVTVSEHPGDSMICDVDNGSGTISGAEVTDVSVTCETLTVGAVTDQEAVHLDWARDGLVDIAYSTDYECEWVNIGTCDNSGVIADADGGSLTLDVETDGLLTDETYTFVLRKFGQVSTPAVGTPASFHLNDTVNATLIDGNRVFAGGDFTHYAADTGGLAVLRADRPGGEQTGTVPGVRGVVYDMVEAPGGGWYIAGSFSRVHGEDRLNVARLHPDGTLDTDWSVPVNGMVTGMHITADRLYLTGDFADVDGNTDHARLVALTHDGDVDTAFAPDTPSSITWAVAEIDGLVYVGGEFQGMGPSAQDYLVALDPVDGAVDTGFEPQVDGPILDLEPVEGDRLAIAGNFDQVGGTARKDLAAIGRGDGALDPAFDAAITAGSLVWTLLPTDDGLLLGGIFETLGGEDRPGLARIDTTDGSVDTAWAPDFVSSFTTGVAVDADHIYVGGNIEHDAGDFAYMRRIGRSDGLQDTDWQPEASAQVYSITIDEQNIWAGGGLTSVKGTAVDYFAAFDLQTGALDTDWNPAFDRPVYALTSGDNALFVGGEFSEVIPAGGTAQPHANATAFHLSDGSSRGWQPQPDNRVFALDMRDDESAVYMGGTFNQVKGQAFKRAAVVDVLKGDPLPGATDPDINSIVRTVSQDVNTNSLLVGGSFSQASGFARDNAAALDPDDLVVRNFTPDPDDTVRAVKVHDFSNTTRNFLGGSFANIAGQAHEHFAIVDGNSDLVSDFQFDGSVYAIDFLGSEQSLLVGGLFSQAMDAGGPVGNRFGFAAMTYDGTTVSLRPETVKFDSRVRAIDQTADHIAVGGRFTTAASQRHGRLVVLDAGTLEPVWTGTSVSSANSLTTRKAEPDSHQSEVGNDLLDSGL